jgi:membrane protein required for colicin V production
MNAVDIGFATVLLVSAGVGAWRGMLREVLSVLSWLAAGYLAYRYHPLAAELLARWLAEPTLRRIAAVVAVFVLSALVFAVISHLLAGLIRGTPLRGVDRVLGLVFGLARGVLIVAVTVLLVDQSALKDEPAWTGAAGLELARVPAQWLREWLVPLARRLEA